MPGLHNMLAIQTAYKMINVRINDIIYLEESGAYLILHTTKAKIRIPHHKNFIEDKLPTNQFSRIHKSFIVSVNFLDSIEKRWVKIGQKELPIGDSYKDSFQQFLDANFKKI